MLWYARAAMAASSPNAVQPLASVTAMGMSTTAQTTA